MSFIASSYWLILLFAILALSISIWTYQLAELSPSIKWLVISLRAFTLFLTFILLLEPAFQFVNQEIRKPKLAVLIDNSLSMTIDDSGVKRDSLLKSILLNKLPVLSEQAEVEVFSFGEALRKSTIESITFNEKSTNLSESIQSLKQLTTREGINAALIISDGEYNSGENPIYDAEKSLIPIYSVLVGDSISRKDIVLRRLYAPEQTIVDTKTSLSGSIFQEGFTGKRIEAVLKTGETIVARKQIELSTIEQTVSFEFIPKDEGETKYTLSLVPLPGEFSTKNNAQTCFIKVLKNKKKVLVISGLPDPEIASVRQSLSSSDKIEGVFFVQKNGTDFFEGALSLSPHQDADVCILIGFPSLSINTSISEKLFQFLLTHKIPVLSLIGLQTDGAQLKRFEPLLAVTISRPNPADVLDNNAFVSLTAQGQSFVSFKPIASTHLNSLQSAPPLTFIDFNFQAKPGAQILWKLLVSGREIDKPVLSVFQNGEKKSATLTAAQFWHYALSPDEYVRALYRQTILGLVEWLSTKEDAKRFQVFSSKKLYDEGQPIVFTASLQDELFNPVSTAEISLLVKNKITGESFSSFFDRANESGLYTTRFEGISKGDYSFTAVAKEREKILGTATGLFTISESNAEFRRMASNPQTMQSIAHQSNGKFYTIDKFNQLIEDMKVEPAFQPKALEKIMSFELANSAVTLLCIIFLLSVEWLIRKLFALP